MKETQTWKPNSSKKISIFIQTRTALIEMFDENGNKTVGVAIVNDDLN